MTRPPDGTAWDAYQADQRKRSLSPNSMARNESGQDRRPARCGWTNYLYQRRHPDQGRAVWQKCERRVCPHCGPRIRQRDLDHDLQVMAGHQLVRRVIAESAWTTTRARIKRAGGLRNAVKVPEGIAVYATAGLTGSVVTDLAAAWTADYDRRVDGSRVMRCKAWTRCPAKGKDTEGGWGSLGMGRKPPAETPQLLRELELYRGEIPPAELSEQAWEAHAFVVPPQESSAFARFAYAVGLHQAAPPLPRPRRRWEAA